MHLDNHDGIKGTRLNFSLYIDYGVKYEIFKSVISNESMYCQNVSVNLTLLKILKPL